MKRFARWSLVVLLPLVLPGVYFEPTYRVRGWLWGEAFFDGRPTSYWRHELDRWKARKVLGINWLGLETTSFERRSTWFEELHQRWFPAPPVDSVEGILEQSAAQLYGPRLLRGGPEAVPVLRELLDDPSPRVRLLAQIGLGMNPDIPDAE